MAVLVKLIAVSVVIYKVVHCDLEYVPESANFNTDKFNGRLFETNQDLCSTNIKKFLEVFKENTDTNKDNFIDTNELHDAFLKQTKLFHDAEITEEFKELDSTGSGRVLFETYAKRAFENYEVLKAGTLPDEEYLDIKNLFETEKKKWFFISGQSEDKIALNGVQFYSFVFSDEFPHIHEYELGITFNLFDKNSDGYLDVQEFVDSIQNVDESLVTLKRKRFTNLLDLNGDSFLDRYEFQLWYNPSLEQKITDEIHFIQETCDDDSDGRLNDTELVNHCDVFLRSQLTGYGSLFLIAEKISDSNVKGKHEL